MTVIFCEKQTDIQKKYLFHKSSWADCIRWIIKLCWSYQLGILTFTKGLHVFLYLYYPINYVKYLSCRAKHNIQMNCCLHPLQEMMPVHLRLCTISIGKNFLSAQRSSPRIKKALQISSRKYFYRSGTGGHPLKSPVPCLLIYIPAFAIRPFTTLNHTYRGTYPFRIHQSSFPF